MDPKACGKLLTHHRRGNGVHVEALRDRFPLWQGTEKGLQMRPRKNRNLRQRKKCFGWLLVGFSLFLVFQKIGTKRSPNTTKLFDDFFLDIRDPRSLGRRSDVKRGDGKATRRALMPCGPLVALSNLIPAL